MKDGFRKYDQEEDNTSHLAQFTLANAVYSALVEGHAAEISARYGIPVYGSYQIQLLIHFLNSRNAMDNASKNAGDMIGSLQLRYNRGRQAAITNELVDIITGASGECILVAISLWIYSYDSFQQLFNSLIYLKRDTQGSKSRHVLGLELL
jgi:hypothetical protein